MAMYDNALVYLLKAWSLAAKLNRPHVSYSIANRLAAVYYENKQKSDAVKWANQSLKIGQETNDNDYYLSNTNILGAIYRDNNDFNMALKSFNDGLDYAEEINDSVKISEIKNNIANTYSSLKNYGNAIIYANSSFEFSNKHGYKALAVVSAELLSNAYASNRDFENAYKYARIYEDLRNDLFFEERDRQISELSVKYETEQREQQIELQKITLEKKDLQIKQKNISTWLFIVLAAFLFLFIIYRQWSLKKLRKFNSELATKNNLIENQKREIETGYVKLKKLDEFKQAATRMLVHDLKSPLNSLTNIKLYDKDHEIINIVEHSSKQMLNLVLNMLDISKAENANLELNIRTIDLNKLIDEILYESKIIADKRKIILQKKLSDNYNIEADIEILKRVFINLIDNAIKFSKEGDTIEILVIETIDKKLKISIKDNGIGIAPKYHKAIFEPYNRINNNKGIQGSVGLGLAFCKLAIEAHGWNIDVKSARGKGSVFSIMISKYSKINESKSKIPIIDKELESSFKITLSDEEFSQISTLIYELEKKQIFAITEIKRILNEISKLDIDNLKNWILEVKDAAEKLDEAKYLSLIKEIKDGNM